MKKLILALAMLAGLSVPASASTFIVTNDARMLSVMDSVRAGDVVQINDGTYTEAPIPTHSGTSGSRINIIGNTTDSMAVICPPWNLPGDWGLGGRDYITWRGIFFDGDVPINGTGESNPASGVRLTHCAIHGGVYIAGTDGGVDSSSLGVWVNGNNEAKIAFVNENGGPYFNGVSPTGAYVTNCTGRLRVYSNTYSGATAMPLCLVSVGTSRREALLLVEGVVVTGNTFDIVKVGTADPAENNGSVIAYYGASNNNVSNNTIAIYDSSSGTSKTMYAWYVRDNSYGNTFTNNNVTIKNGNFTYAYSVSGGGYGHTGNTYTSCWFTDHGTSAECSFGSQGFIVDEAFNYCVFQSDSAQVGWLLNGNINGPLSFDHCTFFAPFAGTAFNVVPKTWTGQLSLRNSIFYTRNTSTNSGETALTINVLPNATQLALDWNLYSRYGATATTNQPYLLMGGGKYYYSWPETVSPTLCTRGGGNTEWDCNSRWGSPLFTDSTVTTFNAQTDATGRGYTAGEFGTDIGVNQPTTDTVRPATITDFALTELSPTQIRLDWTAVGDDSLSGSRCMLYDIRYSNSLITAGNFDAAAQMLNVPLPTASGTAQSMIVNVNRNVDYYFAIKARDEIPHWSAISNVVVRAAGIIGE